VLIKKFTLYFNIGGHFEEWNLNLPENADFDRLFTSEHLKNAYFGNSELKTSEIGAEML